MPVSFDELIEKNLNDMYSLALHLTGSRESAEDLVQDLFVNLKTRRISVQHVKHHRAWLARILYRMFVDQWRKERRSPLTFISYSETESQEYWVDTVADQGPGPEDSLCSDQQQQKILSAMKFLNEQQKDLIVLHDIEGYTLTEIRQITGTPTGTLKSRLHRAREKLFDRLKSTVNHRNMRTETSDQ